MRRRSEVLRSCAEPGPGGAGRRGDTGGSAPGDRVRSRAGRLLPPVAAAVGAVAVVTAASIGLAAASQRTVPASAQAATASPSASHADPHDDEAKVVQHPTVVSAVRSQLGSVLVGERAMTLYVFSADKPGISSCTGACARSWLPVGSHGGKPHGSALVPAAMIGSILRGDGTYQVTFGRRPLYYYAGDRKPGDANGRGRTDFGGTWEPASLQEK